MEALRLLRADGRRVQLLVLGSQDERDSTGWVARLRAEAELGGGWQLRGSVLGQTTGDVLVAADQLNVAGPYAVRGFRDAGLLGDRALVTSAEAATPVLLALAAEVLGPPPNEPSLFCCAVSQPVAFAIAPATFASEPPSATSWRRS